MRELLERLVDEMVSRGVRFEDATREFEARFIARALAGCDGNIGQAAQQLGLHRNTLTRRMAASRPAAGPRNRRA